MFPAPSPIAREVERQYKVAAVGVVPEARERLYAISVERRIAHPAVAAICDAARAIIDRGGNPGPRARAVPPRLGRASKSGVVPRD